MTETLERAREAEGRLQMQQVRHRERAREADRQAVEETREFVTTYRRLGSLSEDLVRLIDADWFDLPDKDQDQILSLHRNSLKDDPIEVIDRMKGLVPEQEYADALEAVKSFHRMVHLVGEAVRHALEKEEQRVAIVDSAIFNDPAIMASITKSYEESKAGKGERFTQEEFLKRTSWT